MEKRILIVNVNWIGDVLFSTPFIKAIRETYPDSYIACLLHPRCRQMLELNPHINELIIYDEEGANKGLLGKAKLVSILRRRRFDMAFILHRSLTKALIAFLAGARQRIGYPTKNRSFLLTTVVEEPSPEAHKVEYFLNLARAVGIRPKDPSYEFYIEDSDRRFIRLFLRENHIEDDDMLVVLCPGGNWDPKRWPKENFAETGNRLAKEFGVKVIISGAKKDMALAEDINRYLSGRAVVACGRTTLKQLGALMERANLVIANDTGPMHIAVAMGANVIALFGPTSPGMTGPYGKGNYTVISRYESCEIPCYDLACRDNRCMRAITVEDVLKEAEKILKRQ